MFRSVKAAPAGSSEAVIDQVLAGYHDVYVAHCTDRTAPYPGVEDMRLAADRSLEEAMVEGIRFTVNELMEQRLPVAAESIQAYNDAILLLETQKEQME